MRKRAERCCLEAGCNSNFTGFVFDEATTLMSVARIAVQRSSTESQTVASRVLKQTDSTVEPGGWGGSVDLYLVNSR
jgi:hypothetical protein